MTVGELQAELAKLDPEKDVRIAVNGIFVPVIGVTAVPNGNYDVIRGMGKMAQNSRFTIDEEGLLGHLARLGLSDEKIAEVLGKVS